MFGLLSRTRRPRPAPRPHAVRLALEWLEGRNLMAAPVITSFSVTTVCDRTAQLSGSVTDENPAGVTISFTGAVAGSTTADGTGHFSFSTPNAQLGTVNAVARDLENLNSNTKTATITNPAPEITSFGAIMGSGGWWTFSGTVSDDCPAGLVVTLSGLQSLTGKTATVREDGTFSLSVQLQPGEEGTVVAQTTDWWGQQSNEAMDIVRW